MTQFYRLLGYGAIGMGAVNAIALFSSLWNPLLGVSIFLALGVGLLAWIGVQVWQLTKADEPEAKQEILGNLGEAIALFVLMILGIIAGAM